MYVCMRMYACITVSSRCVRCHWTPKNDATKKIVPKKYIGHRKLGTKKNFNKKKYIIAQN